MSPSSLPRRYRALVFDWDGTLFDSTAAISVSLQNACSDLDLPVPLRHQAASIIGLGLTQGLQRLLPQLAPNRYDALIDSFRQHYAQHQPALDFFPHALRSLTQLHEQGYVLAVATGSRREHLNERFRNMPPPPWGGTSWFTSSRTADETQSKPHPQMLHELMQELDCPAHAMLMIGDTTHDIELAHNAGVDTLAVSWGAHDTDQLQTAKPAALVHTWVDALQWIDQAAPHDPDTISAT